MGFIDKILGKEPKWPNVNFDDIKKRSRLLVIDDGPFLYADLFRNDGYTIEKWDDVTDISKLEEGYYDLILLDIQGVGKQYAAEQGLGILKHLRQTTPTQIIIAYSTAEFSLKYQDFFHLADASLAKNEDYVVFKREVDKFLRTRFSIDYYLERISALTDANDDSAIMKAVRRAILLQKPKTAEKILNRRGIDNKKIGLVLQIIQVAINIMNLIHSMGMTQAH